MVLLNYNLSGLSNTAFVCIRIDLILVVAIIPLPGFLASAVFQAIDRRGFPLAFAMRQWTPRHGFKLEERQGYAVALTIVHGVCLGPGLRRGGAAARLEIRGSVRCLRCRAENAKGVSQ